MATIKGIAIDLETNEPIFNARIEVDGIVTSTDEDGKFEVEVKPGKYTILCKSQIYQPIRYSVTVAEPGEEVTLRSRKITL